MEIIHVSSLIGRVAINNRMPNSHTTPADLLHKK